VNALSWHFTPSRRRTEEPCTAKQLSIFHADGEKGAHILVVLFDKIYHKNTIGTLSSGDEIVLLRAGCVGWQAAMTS
jgi:hypothetical protein